MTIPLLTPESVKEGSTSQQQEQRARMRDMAIEEERLIKSINDLQAFEKEEEARVRESVASFRNTAQADMMETELFLAKKRKEIEPLEARRAEAMKPIEEIRAEAEERNQKSQEREDAVAGREKAADERNEQYVEDLENLDDRKQLLDEREEILAEREMRVKEEEEKSKESLKGVNLRWAELHELIAVTDANMKQRESLVSAGEQANNIRAKELETRHVELLQRSRQLTDQYETLGRARTEFERMQENNHDTSKD
jgi:hypothetical protein